MTIPIKVNLASYFKYYLTVIDPILSLTDLERKVLAKLLLIYYTNRTRHNVAQLVLSRETRRTIREVLKTTEPSFNNVISSLKKKKLIEGNQLNPSLLKSFPEGGLKKIVFELYLDTNGTST